MIVQPPSLLLLSRTQTLSRPRRHRSGEKTDEMWKSAMIKLKQNNEPMQTVAAYAGQQQYRWGDLHHLVHRTRKQIAFLFPLPRSIRFAFDVHRRSNRKIIRTHIKGQQQQVNSKEHERIKKRIETTIKLIMHVKSAPDSVSSVWILNFSFITIITIAVVFFFFSLCLFLVSAQHKK